jgi:phosphonate transport system ATP-binding protein
MNTIPSLNKDAIMRKVLSFKTLDAAHVIEADHISKVFPNGTRALNDVSLAVGGSDFIAIIGSSGAGKSTFLRCLNRLIRPTAGTLTLLGEDITHVNGRALRQVRRRMGMIFQQFHLVRRLSVLENVLVGRLRFNAASPLRYGCSILRKFPRSEKEVAFDCLKQVGIADLAFQRADTLSGGQQQRVAIARALAQEPEVFLADEPIASLDPRSAETVMRILKDIQERRNIPVLVNLHHIDFARRYGKRIVGMKAGATVFEGKASDLDEEVISSIYGPKHGEEEGCDRIRVSG